MEVAGQVAACRRGGNRCIACPVLASWGDWADDVRGRSLDCGHYLPEEAPDETYAELRAFFAG